MKLRATTVAIASLIPLLSLAETQRPIPYPIVFAKRAPRRASFEMPISFASGGNLFLLKKEGELANLTNLAEGDVASPFVSYDGKRVIFTMKQDVRSFWQIFEIEFSTGNLRQISRGLHNDISPCCLPDGEIVFCSDRPGYLDEYGRGPAMLLHRMNPDGSNLQQISFNMSHDFEPMVARNGALIFSSWLNLPGAHLFPLFTANPDGSGKFAFYIDRSDFSHRLARPVEMPDGRIAAIALEHGNTSGAGKITIIDPRTAIEPAQASAKATDLPTKGLLFRTVSAPPSGALLVSCCLPDDSSQDFGIWLMESDGSDIKLVHNDPHFWDEGAVAVMAGPPPASRPKSAAGPDESASVGALDIYENTRVRASLRCEKNLANTRGTVSQIRAVEGLAAVISKSELLASIRSRIPGIDRWRILGEAPVAPDGSFLVNLPAAHPIRFQTLGPGGRVLTEEANWFYAVPGETNVCAGCHAPVNNPPPNRFAKAISRQTVVAKPIGGDETSCPSQQISRARSDDCAQCHGGIPMDDWERTDAHAKSHRNQRFLNFYEGTDAKGNLRVSPGYKLDFPNTEGVCGSCHAPNSALDDPWGTNPSRVADEKTGGVHCVLCHRTSNIDLTDLGSRPGAIGMEFRTPGTATHFFMGPYDDVHSARDIYMPVHATSEFCAPCHEAKFWGTPIYSTYSEYLTTPEAKNGIRCQDCHMPTEGLLPEFARPGEKQGPLPPIVLTHVNRNHEDALLRQAARIILDAKRENAKVSVEVSVTNAMGGHHLPTGHDMRNIVLLVEAYADGKPLKQTSGDRIPQWGGEGELSQGNYAGQPGKIFAKVLCDELENFPAPSWRRTIVLSDSRIPAHSTDKSRYEFELPPSLLSRKDATITIRSKLIYRRFFKPIVSVKGWNLPDLIMADNEVAIAP